MANARLTVLGALVKMEKDKGYSNIVFNEAATQSNMDLRESAFATALFYGVCERRLTLDYVLALYCSKPLKKLDPEVITILRMGAYQLIYMQSVPDSAAVNESVLLCKKCRKTSAGGFVNAVLRNIIRDGKKVKLSPKLTGTDRLSVEYSCPKELVNLLCDNMGVENTEALLKHSVTAPPLTVRVNTTKTTAEKLIETLKAENVTAQINEDIPNCLSLNNTGSIEKLTAFKNGLFHVQDGASQLCAMTAGAEKDQTVIDLCAAPGGKTFTMAQCMQNSGNLYAFDLYDFKAKLIAEGADRLGLTNITSAQGDAKVHNDNLPLADRVLCDVPCSGLGIISRKPEIKYKDLDEMKALPEIQLAILNNGASYVKKGGRLIYSTCTVLSRENEEIAEKFLAQNKNFKPLPLGALTERCIHKNENTALILPNHFGTDGFFIAAFERIG